MVPVSGLERQEPPSEGVSWVYSTEPQEADWHVVRGVRDRLLIPNSSDRTVFILGEPPEVLKYDRSVLLSYGHVLGPRFRYLGRLPNHRHVGGLLPWRLGLPGIESSMTAEKSLSFDQLCALEPPPGDRITMLVSDKADTALQVARLRFRDYLAHRLPELEVFGRGSAEVKDSLTVFRRGSFHIAVENSVHPGYWTEKLSDPLIAWNYVAYGGHRKNLPSIHANSSLRINPFAPEKSYRKICSWRSRILDHGSIESRREAREVILYQANFHAQVLRFIAAARVRTESGKYSLSLPAHKVGPTAQPLWGQTYIRMRGKTYR